MSSQEQLQRKHAEMPSKQDHEQALASQSACNLSGVAQSLAKVMPRIWNEAREKGKGTEYVNQHPIVRLYAEQIAFLSDGCDYLDATRRCEDKIKEVTI